MRRSFEGSLSRDELAHVIASLRVLVADKTDSAPPAAVETPETAPEPENGGKTEEIEDSSTPPAKSTPELAPNDTPEEAQMEEEPAKPETVAESAGEKPKVDEKAKLAKYLARKSRLPENMQKFVFPTSHKYPEYFKYTTHINIEDIDAIERTDSPANSTTRSLWCADLPGLPSDGNHSGWLITSSQHEVSLWDCTYPSSEKKPVKHVYSRKVDDKLIFMDVCEPSRLLLCSTTTGVSLFSLQGSNMFNFVRSFTTPSEPSQICTLDQIRGTNPNTFVVSLKNTAQIYDVNGVDTGNWKAYAEADISCIRRNSALGCICTGSTRGEVCNWDLRRPLTKPTHIFVKHQRAVTGIECSGTYIMMTSSSDGYLNMWDTRRASSSTPLHTATLDRTPILNIRLLASTGIVAASTTKGFYLFDGPANSITRVSTPHVQPGFPTMQWDLNSAALYAISPTSLVTFKSSLKSNRK